MPLETLNDDHIQLGVCGHPLRDTGYLAIFQKISVQFWNATLKGILLKFEYRSGKRFGIVAEPENYYFGHFFRFGHGACGDHHFWDFMLPAFGKAVFDFQGVLVIRKHPSQIDVGESDLVLVIEVGQVFGQREESSL